MSEFWSATKFVIYTKSLYLLTYSGVGCKNSEAFSLIVVLFIADFRNLFCCPLLVISQQNIIVNLFILYCFLHLIIQISFTFPSHTAKIICLYIKSIIISFFLSFFKFFFHKSLTSIVLKCSYVFKLFNIYLCNFIPFQTSSFISNVF